MRITRRVNDFMIHVGASSRGDTDMKAVRGINRSIKKANIPGTTVQFGGSSQIVSGKSLAERTILGAFSPERLQDFNLEVPGGGYADVVELGSEQHKAYLKLFKAEKIRVGRKLKKTNNFIILNNRMLDDSLYAVMAPLHEISHSFSAEAGLQQRDFYDPWDKVTSAIDEAIAKPGDFPSYEKAFGAYVDRMKGAGLEEARADSGALSFLVKSGLKETIDEEVTSMSQITGYSGITNWKGYEERLLGPMETIIKGLHAPSGEEEAVKEMMSNLSKQGRITAHTSYHSNLQVPEELEEKLRPLLRKNFLETEEKIRSFRGDEVALEYRGRLTSALTGEEKASMRVGDVVSHNFSSRGAEQVFEAHVGMNKTSLLPAMAEESMSTAGTIVGSGRSTAPEIIERTLKTGATKLSRGGLRTATASTARRTSSRIIKRNGNCF